MVTGDLPLFRPCVPCREIRRHAARYLVFPAVEGDPVGQVDEPALRQLGRGLERVTLLVIGKNRSPVVGILGFLEGVEPALAGRPLVAEPEAVCLLADSEGVRLPEMCEFGFGRGGVPCPVIDLVPFIVDLDGLDAAGHTSHGRRRSVYGWMDWG